MGLVTGVYLLFELAFTARLLDVVGTTTDLDEIEEIERAGRLISGIALTLVVWTSWVLPRARRIGHIPFAGLLGSLVVCCTISYTVQEGIVLSLSHGASADQRQAATTLTLVTASVQDEDVALHGIDLANIDRSGPAAKAFFALLPALALPTDSLGARTREALDDLLERRAVRSLGGREQFIKDVFAPSEEHMTTLFNSYVEASDIHIEARQSVDAKHSELYRDYRNSLGRHTPASLPQGNYRRVRRDVRRSGVPVPHDWDPRDEAGFRAAVEERVMDEVRPAYERKMRSLFGEVLPDDLDSETFFQHTAVQQSWRELLGIDYDITLEPGLSDAEVINQVLEPWVQELVAETRPAYIAPSSAFAPDGKHYRKGVDAIRVAYIPLIALSISLLGAVVHLVKTAGFTLKTVTGQRTRVGKTISRISMTFLVALVLGGTLWVSRQKNEVTASELFLRFEQRTADQAGPALALIMRSVIQLQPYAYPITETVRVRILYGITYDFNSETNTPAFEGVSD